MLLILNKAAKQLKQIARGAPIFACTRADHTERSGRTATAAA
jgi:hypothetical protein